MYTNNTLPLSQKSTKNLQWWKTIGWQYFVFQHAASWLMGRFTRSTCAQLKNWQISTFIKKYNVNMQEVLVKDYRAYPTFNAFFTRQLEPNARPIHGHPTGITSPADGILSQFGPIQNHTLVQAKGKFFTTQALLGDTREQTLHPFQKGYFATIYLAPKNYHRIHMPVTGTLTSMRFIPGDLFSVSTHTAKHIDNLFGRNERLVCFFDTALGPMAIVMVGAMLVSSMTTRWAGTVQSKTGKIEEFNYSDSTPPIVLQKGEELGYFNMGSTVVMLMGENLCDFNWYSDAYQNSAIEMGQLLAHL